MKHSREIREISIRYIALSVPFPPCQGFVKLMAKLLDFRSDGSHELPTNFVVFQNAIMTIVYMTILACMNSGLIAL